MKTIVCTKQIRYTYTRTGTETDKLYLNPEDSIYRVNPYDEAAIELALRLKDSVAGSEVDLLTLGDMIAENEVRRCFATGADQLYQVPFNGQKDSNPLMQPDPWVKADLIAKTAKSLNADVILCGKESMDKASGQVGALVAQKLNLPFVSAITDLSFDTASNKVKVQRSAGRGVREVIECSLPAVFSVDLGAELRLPTLEARKQANAYTVRTPDIDLQPVAEKMTCKQVYQARPRTKIIKAPDSSMHSFDRILQLLVGSNVEKKGEMLTGSVDSQVEGIINFLKENEFIESAKSV